MKNWTPITPNNPNSITIQQQGHIGNMDPSQNQQPSPMASTPSGPAYDRVLLEEQIKEALKEPSQDPHLDSKAYIYSEEDFKVKMDAYMALCDRERPVHTIDDFPSDKNAQQDLVQQLVQAMVNVNGAEDSQAKIPMGRIAKLKPFELHLMAWSVLLEIRDIQRGKLSLPRWGKDWPWEEFPSFSARFEAVRQALHSYKAMVSSLFDYVFPKRLVLNPTAEMDRKSANKDLNAKRKKDLDLAKKYKKDKSFVVSKRATTTPAAPFQFSAGTTTFHATMGQQSSDPFQTGVVGGTTPVIKRKRETYDDMALSSPQYNPHNAQIQGSSYMASNPQNMPSSSQQPLDGYRFDPQLYKPAQISPGSAGSGGQQWFHPTTTLPMNQAFQAVPNFTMTVPPQQQEPTNTNTNTNMCGMLGNNLQQQPFGGNQWQLETTGIGQSQGGMIYQGAPVGIQQVGGNYSNTLQNFSDIQPSGDSTAKDNDVQMIGPASGTSIGIQDLQASLSRITSLPSTEAPNFFGQGQVQGQVQDQVQQEIFPSLPDDINMFFTDKEFQVPK